MYFCCLDSETQSVSDATAKQLICVFTVRTSSNMSKVFCPHCGNQTLKKVAVTLSDDGSLHMHFSKNPKVLNPRGLRVRHTHTHTLYWIVFSSCSAGGFLLFKFKNF